MWTDPMLIPQASSRVPGASLLLVPIIAALALPGCAAPQHSTRMTVDDIARMSEQMAESLANSKALRDRTPQSPRWIITLQKVENLSSDLLTEGERWAVMAKLQSSLPIRALWDQRNIRLVIPAEKTRVIQQQPDMQGFEVLEERMEKVGIRGTATGRIKFTNMRVPKENILGPLGKGLRVALTVLDFGRTTFGAGCTGSAKFCLDKMHYQNLSGMF